MDSRISSDEGRGRPLLSVEFEPRFCGNHVADVTVGCSFGCIYCPFSDLEARRHGVSHPVLKDTGDLDRLPAPRSVFLSPSSDAFAPQAAAATHELLEHLLSRGTSVGIVTKGRIPRRTLDLLGRHRDQIEGVAIGVTSLDDRRNRILEPGCPDARVRLENVRELAVRGIVADVRLDPLFPGLDDGPLDLAILVEEAARQGAWAITATYVFAWGRFLRRLRREPLLNASVQHLTERAPMEGGTAFSVPLDRKLATYEWLADLARSWGLKFNTCGCKDLRIREQDAFSSSCRNTWYLDALKPATRSANYPIQIDSARCGPPALPRS